MLWQFRVVMLFQIRNGFFIHICPLCLKQADFLRKYRMYKASELLKNTKMPVAEVGASVGYDNQLHFPRAFRNIFGISPKNYRDNHRLSQNN
ncbi:MAG: helix-turn-helix transcriptional regulator [Solobacterium sp.]|nr:helix-turn-helix transcriptional regulator [Solobacterium sp.]